MTLQCQLCNGSWRFESHLETFFTLVFSLSGWIQRKDVALAFETAAKLRTTHIVCLKLQRNMYRTQLFIC